MCVRSFYLDAILTQLGYLMCIFSRRLTDLEKVLLWVFTRIRIKTVRIYTCRKTKLCLSRRFIL